MSLIIDAAQYAAKKHAGQFRKYTNAPYIMHPCRVAGRVAIHDFASEELIAAAYLHDVVEDCDVTIEEIRDQFGLHVARYVEELTNTSKLSGLNRSARKAADRQRLASVSTSAKIVKLIDRIDNLREIDWKDEFAKTYSKESRLLVAVLASADSVLAEELLGLCDRIDAMHAEEPIKKEKQ